MVIWFLVGNRADVAYKGPVAETGEIKL